MLGCRETRGDLVGTPTANGNPLHACRAAHMDGVVHVEGIGHAIQSCLCQFNGLPIESLVRFTSAKCSNNRYF